jgi:hypothetical protein
MIYLARSCAALVGVGWGADCVRFGGRGIEAVAGVILVHWYMITTPYTEDDVPISTVGCGFLVFSQTQPHEERQDRGLILPECAEARP